MKFVTHRLSWTKLKEADEAAGNEMEDGPNHRRKPRPRKKNKTVFGANHQKGNGRTMYA